MVKNFTATILKGHAHSLLLTDSDRIHSWHKRVARDVEILLEYETKHK
jgi:hypothetical protein